MKKTVTILLLALGSMLTASAQDGCQSCDRLVVEARFGAVTKDNGVSPVVGQVRLGYKVLPRVGAFAHFEGAFGHHEGSRGTGTYMATNSIGGGLAYRLTDLDGITFDIHGLVGTTVGGYTWKHTLYEGGITMGFSGRWSPTFGIGFRVMDSRTKGISTHQGLVATLGFRL